MPPSKTTQWVERMKARCIGGSGERQVPGYDAPDPRQPSPSASGDLAGMAW
jgi:hypothetical protein